MNRSRTHGSTPVVSGSNVFFHHLKDISQIGLSPPMLSGLKKGSQPLKSDGQDMETLLQWRPPCFDWSLGLLLKGWSPADKQFPGVYMLYIYYIYFDTWKILEKTSAFLEKTHPLFAAKIACFPRRNPFSTAPHELVSPGTRGMVRTWMVENEGQQKMMQDESQRNTGVDPCKWS